MLADLGAEPVFFADVDTQLLGYSPSWDRVAVVKYPTRRSFIDMQARPDFQAKYVHKGAGMAQTIIAGCQPAASPADDLDPATLADQARFNAFPSRAAFMAVVSDPARLEAQHDHRETAIADTYTMILRPLVDRLVESTSSTPPTTETTDEDRPHPR